MNYKGHEIWAHKEAYVTTWVDDDGEPSDDWDDVGFPSWAEWVFEAEGFSGYDDLDRLKQAIDKAVDIAVISLEESETN